MKVYNKYIMFASLLGVANVAMAQDSYEAQGLINSDLNGTARYVSMGGALGALGGDVTVMGTNPAGTAIYKKSDAAFTLSGVFTKEGAMGHDASRMSLDQGGALFSFDMENATSKGLQYVNFGVNYNKKRNFLGNSIINVQNLNGIYSQTHQIANMADNCYYTYEYDFDAWGLLPYIGASTYKDNGDVECLGVIDEEDDGYHGRGANEAFHERATYGAVTQIDANLSFNVSDRFFYGVSVGMYDINSKSETMYSEASVPGIYSGLDVSSYVYDITSWREISGQGIDLKFGFICRPFEDSPFRFGLTAHTPTWYSLTNRSGATITYDDYSSYGEPDDEYDYELRTPWKFGVSLGHTIGRNIAIGAEYEYQDLSTTRYDVSEYNNYQSDREYFKVVNNATKQTLKDQHTIKVGAEYKPITNLALRLGYNFVTSPIKSNAYRTITYDGVESETSYTNWKPIQRFCAGVGYKFNGGYVDVAYQYQIQKGDFYAFDDETFKPTSINNNRSQLMATLGFRF